MSRLPRCVSPGVLWNIHAFFQEHKTEVSLQPDHVCGTCHLTCDILTLATTTSNANWKHFSSDRLQRDRATHCEICDLSFVCAIEIFLLTFLLTSENSVKKVKAEYSSSWESNPSQSYGASLAMWDHTVLPAIRRKWIRPAITPANQSGTRFTYPGGMEGWVEVGSLIAARPGIEPTTAWSQVRRPNRYPSHASHISEICDLSSLSLCCILPGGET